LPSVKSVRSSSQRSVSASALSSVRVQIDSIDDQILELLRARLACARQVGTEKAVDAKRSGKKRSSILVPPREEDILQRLRKQTEAADLPWSLVQRVYADVIALCRAAQGQLTAHVLGPVGTHSEWAARARFGGSVSIERHETIPAAIRAAEQAVASGDANSVAVVPFENSQEGTVSATVDTILTSSLQIVGEGYYRVRHALLSRASSLREIKVVYSHPMGLAQCGRWLRENLPQAKLVETSSTAEAARRVSDGGGKGLAAAAIASPQLENENLRILVSDIQDSIENTTRFGVLGATTPAPSEGGDKTSLVFSLPNKSGSLAVALQVFSKNGLNMTKIESRPHKGLQWEYLFYVDIDGHVADSRVARALEAFDSKVRFFKVLGSYPKGRAWN
jgi:chorismate mutase/prephenate dehydratase